MEAKMFGCSSCVVSVEAIVVPSSVSLSGRIEMQVILVSGLCYLLRLLKLPRQSSPPIACP